jgi:hypothetical protein
MTKSLRKLCIVVGLTGVATAYWGAVGGAEPATTAPLNVSAPRTLPTATVMHAKLTGTQQVLAGLLAEDYDVIAASARELVGLARDVPPRKTGDDTDDQVYEHFRYEMLRLSAELEQMGVSRNLSGAAYVHGNLTSACIGCHQHLRDQAPPIQLMREGPARALFEVDDAPAAIDVSGADR